MGDNSTTGKIIANTKIYKYTWCINRPLLTFLLTLINYFFPAVIFSHFASPSVVPCLMLSPYMSTQ